MKIKFSKKELQDLTKAWLIISLAFAIVLTNNQIFTTTFLLNFLLAAITVGTAFIFHEMGHKFVAQKYGCFAEFRANDYMLFIAIIISFLGFIFVAPGAVMIAGRVSKERNGKISVAGPAINIIFAIIFLGLTFLFPLGFIGKIMVFGFFINAWLALFNLLPFWILDGKKVFNWNKPIYFLVMGSAIALVILSNVLPLQPLF